MQKLAYTVAEKHGRLFVAGDRVDLLARSGRALWSLLRLQKTTELYVARTALFTLLDAASLGGGIGKSTEVARTAVDKTSGWLLTDQAKGQYGVFSFTTQHANRGIDIVAGLMIARSAVRTVTSDRVGRGKVAAAAKRFKEDGLAALGFYKISLESDTFQNQHSNGQFMGMPLGSAAMQNRHVITPFACKEPIHLISV